jgi:hypothetical protein
MKMDCRRGQVFSVELMIAYVLFMIVLLVVVYLWGSVIKDIFESESLYEIEGTAVDVSENLMRTRGMPEDWNSSNVKTIGLVNPSRNLDEYKVLNFIELMDSESTDNSCGDGITNYECNKHLTGIGLYDFEFAMEYLNGSSVLVRGINSTTGKQPSDDKQKVTIVRTVLLNETIVRARVTVWK